MIIFCNFSNYLSLVWNVLTGAVVPPTGIVISNLFRVGMSSLNDLLESHQSLDPDFVSPLCNPLLLTELVRGQVLPIFETEIGDTSQATTPLSVVHMVQVAQTYPTLFFMSLGGSLLMAPTTTASCDFHVWVFHQLGLIQLQLPASGIPFVAGECAQFVTPGIPPVGPISPAVPSISTSNFVERNRAGCTALSLCLNWDVASIQAIVGPLMDIKGVHATMILTSRVPEYMLTMLCCLPDNLAHFLTWTFLRQASSSTPTSGKTDGFHLSHLTPRDRVSNIPPGSAGVRHILELVRSLVRLLSSLYGSVSKPFFLGVFQPLIEAMESQEDPTQSLQAFDPRFVMSVVSKKLCALAVAVHDPTMKSLSRSVVIEELAHLMEVDCPSLFLHQTLFLQANPLPSRASFSAPVSSSKRPFDSKVTTKPATLKTSSSTASTTSSSNGCTPHLMSLLLPNREGCTKTPCPYVHSPLPSPATPAAKAKLAASVDYIRDSNLKGEMKKAIMALK